MTTYKIFEQGTPLMKASYALILLHGRGASALDILGLGKLFADDRFYIVAPEAPHFTWYPQSFMAEDSLNEPALSVSVAFIQKVIDDIAKHIPKDHIYIMGFSQGACLSLEVSSRSAEKYGGIAAFSGGLIGKTLNKDKYSGNFKKTKVFIGDSENDPFIPLQRCVQSKVLMEKMNAEVTLKAYPGTSHTITQEEINWVKKNIMSV